jgi:hypothetical protein
MKLEIEVNANPFTISALKLRVEKFAKLDSDTQTKLEALSSLDTDTLDKLVEVAKSEKLIAMFKDNWEMIKMM